ncbi:MAG: nucleotide sugar dehydrogenase [candidate division Zixibacteria bacterium]|nr:nucleotide sugar dehydrogenase [candidate division Zixibacteria bacterium]MBU1472030.1 nucleotide sugar dehydrogenase [candidate division Zixibacteria bacterium]MBU2624053.1 nucleotide sugar dehydrogenase [candidate division Zixibacteria bacterium]
MKTLEAKIRDHSAVVGVIGLGYVGLPLAVEFAEEGFKVIGFDISKEKCKLISAGKSDILDVSSERVKAQIKIKNFVATGDFTKMKQVDCVAICVPTPLSKTKDPDVTYILSAVNEAKNHLHKDMLVVLESTTYPGTTEELIRPLLEEKGFTVGTDLYLAFSPERIDPGNEKYGTKNTPRIVGGCTPKCCKMAKLFYEQVINHAEAVSSTQAAEMVKLLENTFRSVNIALVNEVALMCDRLKIDVWEIIDAASTKPFGFMPFYPGPGLGGHCIPIDPHYLAWKLKSLNYYSRFIELAGDINSHMPEYVVDRVTRALNARGAALRGAKVVVLGVAYKRDISDVRESPALDVMKLLDNQGAKISYCDPYVPVVHFDDGDKKSVKLTAGLLQSADIVVVLTDHTNFNYQWIADNSQLIFDTRNACKRVRNGKKKIIRL